MSRIFLLQQDPAAAERLCEIVLRTSGLELVGAARTLAHARPMLEHDTADLLISDLRLADGRPTTLTDELRGPGRRGRPLLLVAARSFEDPQLMYALRHGADGYVMHGDSRGATAAAIKLVLGGGSPMSAELARQVKAHFAASAAGSGRAVLEHQIKTLPQLPHHGAHRLRHEAQGAAQVLDARGQGEQVFLVRLLQHLVQRGRAGEDLP